MNPPVFQTRALEEMDKQAYEQKMTAQLLLWDARLRREERRKMELRKQKITSGSTTLIARRKLEGTWQTLIEFKEIDCRSCPHLKARAFQLLSELERSILGLRQAMEC